MGIRGTSDAICREHGLSIIEPSEPLGGPVSRAEWEAARQGKATVRDLIRQDVDEAIRQAYTYQSFLSQLRRMGYRVKTGPRVKHTAILPPGGKGYIRLDSLKDGYTEADIQARLAAVRSGEAPPDTPPTTFLSAGAGPPVSGAGWDAPPPKETHGLSSPLLPIPLPAGGIPETPSGKPGGVFHAGGAAETGPLSGAIPLSP